jgi:CubicO group peptidase (beta-lactamase class C family)
MVSKIMKSRKRKKWLIVLLIFSLILIGLMVFWPRAPKPPETVKSIAELEIYLEKLVDFGTPPGMSLVVVKNDSIIYSKGFGWADQPRKIRATPETVYHWWSITKIVTAIAILQLQEQGKLHLDDPVSKFLPFFKVQYLSPTSKTITIRNLLNHSSGIPDPVFKIMRWIHHEGEPNLNQTALVEKVLPDFSKLTFEPGTDTRYTNIGYMVLGAIIEKVTNQTYENYIRQNILQPLGMDHTDFIYTKEMETYEAAGSHPLFDKWTPLVPFIAGSYIREIYGNHIWLEHIYTDQTPPSGLIGSVMDAACLERAFLNNGVFDDRRILSAESVKQMTTESHIKKVDDPFPYFVRQGFGWQVYKDRGGLMLRHEGGGIGFNTIMQIYPDEKLGFILFSNDVKCEYWQIIKYVASLNW